MKAVGLFGQALLVGGAIWLVFFRFSHAFVREGALYSRGLQGRSYRMALLTGAILVVIGAALTVLGWLLS